jgi:hypothetical protein
MKFFRTWIATVVILAASAAMLTGCGSASDAIDAATSRPSAPTNVHAAAGSVKGTVIISWDTDNNLNHFVIYGSDTTGVSPSNFKASVPNLTGTSYTVSSGLNSGTTYYFVVTAVNAKGESAPSSEVHAIPN